MSYAAELIAEVRKARTLTTDKAVADALGIDPSTLNQWKHGKGSPMPPERVIELCKLAGITEANRAYWLTGIQRDAVTITSVRRALDVALDRLRPVAAAVGLLLVFTPTTRANAPGDAGTLYDIASQQTPSGSTGYALPVNVYYVKFRAWLRRAWTALAPQCDVPRGMPA